MERKLVQYIECTEGKIQAAIAFNAQYPEGTRAEVALCVADGGTAGTWVHYFQTIYDDKLVNQPDGQLGLYISNFFGPAGFPPAFCRPSTAEVARGISRGPQVILTFEQLRRIFLKARSIHQGTYHWDNYNDVESTSTILQEAELVRHRADWECQRANSADRRVDEAMQKIAALEEQLRLVEGSLNAKSAT